MYQAIILRTLLIYIIVLVLVRLMGKREIGQLSTFDLVVSIIIAELAAIPMESHEKPLFPALLPMFIVVGAEIFVATLALKSLAFREFLDGKPSLIISNGKPVKKEMKRARYNLSDLLTQLREQGVTNIEDVEFAVLETSGKLSILLKSQKRPVTPEDLKIETNYEGVSTPIIMDGKVQQAALKRIELTEEWLRSELNKQGYKGPEEIFFGCIDSQGKVYFCSQQESEAIESFS